MVRGEDLWGSTGAQVAVMAALGAFPPRYGHVPLWRDSQGQRLSKREDAEGLARGLATMAQASEGAIEVRGPYPCPIARIADRWRVQVEIVAANAGALQKFLTAARNAGTLVPGEAVAVDVDPVALM